MEKYLTPEEKEIERLKARLEEAETAATEHFNQAEWFKNRAAQRAATILSQQEQIAAYQAREQELRSTLGDIANHLHKTDWIRDWIDEALASPSNIATFEAAINQAKLEEREACAKACELLGNINHKGFKAYIDCVEAIRARK